VKPRQRHYLVEKIDGCCCDTHRELENGKTWVRRLRVGTTCGVAGRTMVEAVNRQEIGRCDDQVGSGTSLYTYGPNVCSSIYSRTFLTASWQSNVREIDMMEGIGCKGSHSCIVRSMEHSLRLNFMTIRHTHKKRAHRRWQRCAPSSSTAGFSVAWRRHRHAGIAISERCHGS
jgi:hypothetical protein